VLVGAAMSHATFTLLCSNNDLAIAEGGEEGYIGEERTESEEMARMIITYTTRERRKCSDGGGGIVCDYDEARAGTMLRRN